MSFKLIQFPQIDDPDVILQWQRDTFQRLSNSDISPLFIVSLGAWNMFALPTLTVSFPSLNVKSIGRVGIFIIEDGELIADDASYGNGIERVKFNYPLNTIEITRTTGGLFDSTDYDDITMNRGSLWLWT